MSPLIITYGELRYSSKGLPRPNLIGDSETQIGRCRMLEGLEVLTLLEVDASCSDIVERIIWPWNKENTCAASVSL